MTNYISKMASYESRSCLTEDNYKGDHGSASLAKVVLQSQAPQAQILPCGHKKEGPLHLSVLPLLQDWSQSSPASKGA